MPLTAYTRKRNFKKTPEPAARRSAADGVLHFVVQEHHASRLHYDFRLECQGVLKSWAVPKGVPDDPTVRRLAIEVEDHPLEYRHFHGTIPEGNYGAGTVAIWDEGAYYVDKALNRRANEQRVGEELDRGRLSFYLDGKRLHGRYALVRLRNPSGKKNQWLLMKKQEEGLPAETPAAVMPHQVNPMLATLTDAPFDRKGWAFEVKWDGYRILAEVKGHQVRLYTRNGIDYTERFSEVAAALQPHPDVVLDGEVVAVDDRGVSHFQLLQNYMRQHAGQLLYYVFDVPYAEGKNLQALPLSARRKILGKFITGNGPVRLSEQVEEKGKAFYKAAKANGLEGIIAKNLSSTYQPGHRSLDWLKIKAVQEQEAIICGFTAPKGGRRYFGALILGLYKNSNLIYVGHTGGGFDDDQLKDVHNRLARLITDQCPFKVRPKTNAPVTWVQPRLLCEVKFQEWTSDGRMRQPVFLGLREDKNPAETYHEMPAPVKQVLPSDQGHVLQTKVELTHLEKIYWPEEGYTKGDVVRYYQEVAPYILPYLKDRPHALHRQPNGIQDAGFFQKDINFKPPAWVQVLPVVSESRQETVHYLVCTGMDSMTYMNNLGCIELNPWCSTAQQPMHPDFMALDFDPVDVAFPALLDVVREARHVLLKAKCDGYCKTSGARGMHVYIPLGRKYTYDQVKDFAHIVCLAIHKRMPDITSLERSPEKRRGRVYLDYLQNHYTATMAAPYALRPRAGATVSAPLAWPEVMRGVVPEDFTIKTMAARLKKKGDLWKGVLGKGINMQVSLKLLERL